MLGLVAVIALTEVAAVYTNWFLRLWTQSFKKVDARASPVLKPAFGIPMDLITLSATYYLLVFL